jgi:glutathione peroxidase
MQNKAFSNAYDFTFTSIDGNPLNLKDFIGKPILIVNTASLCGFTNQYKDLEDLHQQYKKNELIIIAIPSNDFGSQELTSNEKVKDFCQTNFNITFLLTEITSIKGKNGHPFFKWVESQEGLLSFPKWNFYKYLINKDGELNSWYSSITKPNSEKIKNAIDILISSK